MVKPILRAAGLGGYVRTANYGKMPNKTFDYPLVKEFLDDCGGE